MPLTAVIKSNSTDGYLTTPWMNDPGGWVAAHDAASALWTGNTCCARTAHDRFPWIGGTNSYLVARGLLDFTAALGATAVVSDIVLSIRVFNKQQTDVGHADLHIVEGVQNIPVQLTDFGAELPLVTSGGSIAYGAIVNNAWNNITLNAIGRSWFNPNGVSKLCLKVSGDINNVAPALMSPSPGNAVWFRTSETVGFEPYLTVTYTLGPAIRGGLNPAFMELLAGV